MTNQWTERTSTLLTSGTIIDPVNHSLPNLSPPIVDHHYVSMDIYSNVTNQSTAIPVIDDHSHTHWTTLETVIFATWLSISMVLAIVGNFMVITVVWRHRGMRTRTNMFIVNLAIADFLIGILLAPFSLTTLIAHDWILGNELCFINSFLNAVCFMTSLHTLMYISIHKYLSITRPLTRITKCKILIMIIAAWVWAIICAALTTFILSHAVYKEKTMQCGPEYPTISAKSLAFHFIIQISNLFLPLGIMLFAYLRMFREIKKHMQRLDENTAMDRQQIFGQQRRVTVTLVIVLACFVLCWTPYILYANYVTFIEDKSSIPSWANAIAYCFGYMNSACNPIIYAWRSPSFREGYKEILCQEPSYVVSDDTVHESSPSPRRKLSLFVNSVRGSRSGSRRSSDESQKHHYIFKKSTDKGKKSSHSILRKLTGRAHSKGSSIIKRDGSVILVKNGKIISMREDIKRRKRSSDLDDVFLPNHSPSPYLKNGGNHMKVQKPEASLKVLYENKSENIDSIPLIENGHHPGRCHSIEEKCLQTDTNDNNPKPLSQDTSNIQITVTAEGPEQIDSDCNQCNRLTTFKPFNGQCKHLAICSTSSERIKRSRSDTICQNELCNDTSECLSRSEQNIFRLPLLKSPSVERFDKQALVSNTSSDPDLSSPIPLYTRRWRSRNGKKSNVNI